MDKEDKALLMRLEKGQQKLESDFAEMKERQTRLEHVVVNMEQTLVRKVDALFDAWSFAEDIIKETRAKQDNIDSKLDDHELRILRLERLK